MLIVGKSIGKPNIIIINMQIVYNIVKGPTRCRVPNIE